MNYKKFIGVLLLAFQMTITLGVEVVLSTQNQYLIKGDNKEIIKQSEMITIERCINIALKNHPNIVAADSTIDINKSRVGPTIIHR